MKTLAENNVLRFSGITRKKNSFLANFKVKGLLNGTEFNASISVDITELDLHPGDSLEKIIEECARRGMREFKKAEVQFEGIDAAFSEYLGVAQLG